MMTNNFERQFGFAFKNVEFVLNFWDNILIEYPHINLIATKGLKGPYLTTAYKINKIAELYLNEFENRFGSLENDIKSQINYFKMSQNGYPSLSVPYDELIFNDEIKLHTRASYIEIDHFIGEMNIPFPEETLIDLYKIDETIKIKKFRISLEEMAALPYLVGRAKYAKCLFTKYKNSSLDESIETNSKPNIKIVNLSNEIDEIINMMHPTGWEKVFWSEEDYQTYKKILIEFFTTKDYSIPDLKIKIRPKSKTNIIGIFKKLHERHSLLAGHLKDDTKLFEIVKILDQWSSQSNSEICKRISSDSLK